MREKSRLWVLSLPPTQLKHHCILRSASSLCPSDSPLMTASNSNPRFSMALSCNFPKALIATGLAAALVGCGGGSSDTAMEDLSQEEMDRGKMEEQKAAQQQAVSTAKAAFNEARSTLKTALDSATTNQERITAYEAMKSASEAFRDALYNNNGSAADLLIATNEYDRSTSEISKLEMMIADDEEMKQKQMRETALRTAKRGYEREEEDLNLVLHNLESTDRQKFDARIEFKRAADAYLSVLLSNDDDDGEVYELV